jgi:hypothetical protein
MGWFGSGSAAHAGGASGDHSSLKSRKGSGRISWTADKNKATGWRPSKPAKSK